jgi:hypothetical protein
MLATFKIQRGTKTEEIIVINMKTNSEREVRNEDSN